jgi:aquaporin Z
MMMKYVAEFIGTFVFLSVILQATSPRAPWPSLAPILIVVGLLAGIVITAGTSGGHLNPAVSTMMFLNKSLPAADFIPYVGAQLLGAVAAKMLFDMLNKA